MLKKIETFYSKESDGSLTSDYLVVAKMTALSIHDKCTEDAGLVEPFLEVFVIRAGDSDISPPVSRYYSLETIRQSFFERAEDCIEWVVAGHALPVKMMVEILDWTDVTEYIWKNPSA